MRIEIEIPKEFEDHFNQDRFEDSLNRLSCDANVLAGRYEQELAEMLINAFKESTPAKDLNIYLDRILKELEEDTECPNASMFCADASVCGFDEMRKQAKEIARLALGECNSTTIKSTNVIKQSSNFIDTESKQGVDQEENNSSDTVFRECRSQAIDGFVKTFTPVLVKKLEGWTNSDDLVRWCTDALETAAKQFEENISKVNR